MNKLIVSIEKAFLDEKQGIYEAMGRDYKEHKQELEYSIFEKIFKELGKIEFINNSNSKTILAIYNGNTYLTLAIILKSLINGNNIILIPDELNYTTNEITKIIKNVLANENSSIIFKTYHDVDIRKALKEKNMIDRILYFGDKRNYRGIKCDTNIELKYNGYGSLMIYVDDEDKFETELEKIDEYSYLNNSFIYKFEGDIDEAITRMNKDGKNDTCIILTEDEEKIKKFKQLVNSTNILVNEVRFDLEHELPEELFE